MQDLSRYRKKDHIEIQTRYASLLLIGSVTLVGLVFALGVLVGAGGRAERDACDPPDPLAALDAMSGEPTLGGAEIEMRSFHERLTHSVSSVPTPASLADESGSEEDEDRSAAARPMEPAHEESPIPERVPDADPGSYSLQVASFSSQAEASEMARKLRRAGHKSFLVSVKIPDEGRVFRVRVGPFNSRQQAWRYKAEFEEKERLPAFVVKRRTRS